MTYHDRCKCCASHGFKKKFRVTPHPPLGQTSPSLRGQPATGVVVQAGGVFAAVAADHQQRGLMAVL